MTTVNAWLPTCRECGGSPDVEGGEDPARLSQTPSSG